MKPKHNPYRPRDMRLQGPSSLGGLVAYLMVFPAFVAVLAAPGIVLAASFGALSALAVAKLKDSSLMPASGMGSSRRSSQVSGHR